MRRNVCVQDVFSYRSGIMGIAMLCIMLFHANINTDNIFLQYVKQIGYGGVDIFLLCSGYGCYHSFVRNPDCLAFIKKRFLKAYPKWSIFMFVWILAAIILRQIPF